MNRVLGSIAVLLASGLTWAGVQVNGLFKGAAYLSVDGTQKLLREGESLNGVRLISADTSRAIVDIDGVRQTLTLTAAITTQYQQTEQASVSIPRNAQLKYMTTAEINGQSLPALVDTGANLMAMSQLHAKRLGIPYQTGRPSRVSTASGVARAYQVMLNSVTVGGIEARHVPAVVIEGAFPEDILLGMSYLEHVNMEEKNNILYLRSKY